ncbi:MAG: 50S ribosomal protein L23 [Leptospiraceae bacterium]|nr:50S ribosomal protein L23 [Leptospiraceae bacterium]MCK6380132.1 50S ribosomal protein L23 [Leptospiraceae bacterium]
MNIENVVIAPLLTEKAQDLEKIGTKTGKRTIKYSFKVHPRANKTLIKEFIKKTYNVSPSSISIMVYKGKNKKFRNSISVRPHWKKAIVTFSNGSVLDFTKGG